MVAAPLAAWAVVAAGLLPWTVSGAVTRHSFATVRSARLLLIAGSGPFPALLGAWFLVPVLAAVSLLATTLRRDRLAGACALVVGLAAVALAVAVLVSPLGRAWGLWAGLAAGVAALVSGGNLLVARGAPGAPGPP